MTKTGYIQITHFVPKADRMARQNLKAHVYLQPCKQVSLTLVISNSAHVSFRFLFGFHKCFFRLKNMPLF